MTSTRLVLAGLALALCAPAQAGEWPHFRGPNADNISPEKGLPSSWSRDGAGQVWRQPWTGRSTPAVFDGRVCASGREANRLETIACFDAKDGRKLWEHRFPVFNTTIPYTRVGWASVTGDPETGWLYAQNGDGHLVVFDRAGKIAWQRRLGEDLGRVSGYGGRTHTVLIDEDRAILSVVGTGWGDLGPVRQRYLALDKRTGAVLWYTTPNDVNVEDFNNQSNPVIATIGGRRLVIGGGADGWLYAVDSRTGESVWRYHLSQKSLNAPVTVVGDVVYANYDGEPVDQSFLGRVVALDGTGTGDITARPRIWTRDALAAGFAAPVHYEGRLYVVSNAGNLVALDAKTGDTLYDTNIGTVGRSAVLVADGKLYVTEVNGVVMIVKAHADRFEVLDKDHLMMDGRQTEIWGQFAAAYGRLYLMAEDGLYCLGDPKTPYTGPAPATARLAAAAPPEPGQGAVASVQLVPAEIQVGSGDSVTFSLRAFDASGRRLADVAFDQATLSLEGLKGQFAAGTFRPDAAAGTQAGKVKVTAAGKEAVARVRVYAPMPWSFDFDALGRPPGSWVAAGRLAIADDPAGGKTLHKAPAAVGLNRATVFIAPSTYTTTTIESDVKAAKKGRRQGDIGLIAGGYTLDLQGAHQRLQVRSWASELAFSKQVDFAWEPDTWYRMKLHVENGATCKVRGKVWKRGEAEPEAWTIEYDDPSGIAAGAPGVYADSSTNLDWDNLKVVGK
jgi:outer membrane protein assembly factor BamB